MSFNSLTFIEFFATILLVSFSVPQKWKVPLLTVASYGFYNSLSSRLALLLLALTIASYGLAQIIERSNGKKRDIVLYASLALTLGSLFYFKYFNFFIENLSTLLNTQPITTHHVSLEAIGLSFIIFQIVSYLLDVFYETTQAEKNFTNYALYVAFFPKLLQGPIERAENLLPQIRRLEAPNFAQIKSGLIMMLWGLFLKMVVADRIGELYVTPVYSDIAKSNDLQILLAVYFYTLQLYFDFAGYTKVAIGAASCFGLRLSENFNSPLLATSCTDFWRRWHITLSSWLRDYLFLPLQMHFRNYGIHGAALAIIITFALAGLWHGASWGFVIFGLIHGIWLSAEQYSNHLLKKRKHLKSIINSPAAGYFKLAGTYTLVSIAFIFFRAPDENSAIKILAAFLHLICELPQAGTQILSKLGDALLNTHIEPYAQLGLFNALVLATAFVTINVVRNLGMTRTFDQLSVTIQWLLAELLIISVVILGVHSGSGFAYFKF